MLTQVLVGLGLAVIVALLAYRAGSLDRGGALAAVVVGGLTFGLGGVGAALMLLTFFITSSLVSRLGQRRKWATGERFAKGSRRDVAQVSANGALAAVFSVIFGIGGSALALAAVAGALAAVTADTWATEIGILARSQPRLVTTWRAVPAGTSGAVTWEGSLASLAGALLIGAIAATAVDPGFLVPASAGGLFGSLVDSGLGASVQARYHCPSCGIETEKNPLHGCGTPTQQVAGWSWLNNDAVNFLASAVGAGCASILAFALRL